MGDRPDEPSHRQPSSEPSRPAGKGGESGDRDTVGWYKLGGLGLEFIAGVLALGWFGWWLDRRWDTGPWLMIAGGAVGFAAGLVTLIRTAKRAFKD
jgi:F0F1-type ATP synthase assembly protein I